MVRFGPFQSTLPGQKISLHVVGLTIYDPSHLSFYLCFVVILADKYQFKNVAYKQTAIENV